MNLIDSLPGAAFKDVSAFVHDNPSIIDRINGFPQPFVDEYTLLFIYYLASERCEELLAAWPLPLRMLRVVFSDLGIPTEGLK